MDNETKVTRGTNSETSGSEAQSSGQESTGGDQSSKTAYDKLLREKKNASLALQETREKLKELESFKQDMEEKELLKQKQYETVISNLKNELKTVTTELGTTKRTVEAAKMATSVMNELKKLGFVDNEANKQAAMKLVNHKSMAIDPQTGTVVGAEDSAKEFYKQYSSLGFFQSSRAMANHDASRIDINSLSRGDLNKMSKKELEDLIRNPK
jgi:dsDNA-specific endonuclease/ATPase MutS2